MSTLTPIDRRSRVQARGRASGIALVATLTLIVLTTVLIISFVSMMSLDRTSTASYSQSSKADQLARGGLTLILGQLRSEMSKDAPPDGTYSARPLYTNITSANILPQSVGTNAAMPGLIKISTNAPFFTGSLLNGSLRASAISTATPSINGRSISATRWSKVYLGTFPNSANTPYWIFMTRGGPTNASGISFGKTIANSINNPTSSNTNYAIGRIAYAIYDEGRLLDVTVAGYSKKGSTALSADQLHSIKGTLAGADLAPLGIDPDALVAWRNKISAANATSYTNYIRSYQSTNVPGAVYPGDTTFLSRQDLIRAAQNSVAGLNTTVLTNLTTFTRERNAPSWGPLWNASSKGGNNGSGNMYAYKDNALSSSTTNSYIPYVRHTAARTITSYRLNGASYTYNVQAGDPLVYRRFPLDRLKWIGPTGPQNGGTAQSIQACFGLVWGPSDYNASKMGLALPNASSFNVWKYVGPSGSTEQKRIKTLAEVATEIPAREPNFFELLQAGILTGALGKEGQLSQGKPSNQFLYYTYHEYCKTYQVFRIGAAMLSQYDPTSMPIIVEYTQPGTEWGKNWNDPWQAVGIENLPYFSMLTQLAGANSASTLECYLLFGLSNPHQGAVTNRPPIRLRIKGSVAVANNYGKNISSNYTTNFNFAAMLHPYGYEKNLDDTILFSNAGVNGFTDPHAILPTDVNSPGSGTFAGMAWASLPSIQGNTYVGYRMPDFAIDPTAVATGADDNTVFSWSWLLVGYGSNTLQPFNAWLEYQNSNGEWIPYNYHAGINDSVNCWYVKINQPWTEFMGQALIPDPSDSSKKIPIIASLQPMDPPSSAYFFYFRKNYFELSDPRSVRFNYGTQGTATSTPDWTKFLNSSLWSSTVDSANQVNGRPTTGNQSLFNSSSVYPAAYSRNNSSAASTYTDMDGVQRIADSGLFTTASKISGWTGNPYALSATRVADRPLILNRPFYSVGELGYVFRDDPWKTLNFFTDNSADAALLDLFTVGSGENDVVAGCVNLNTASTLVLQCLLGNTIADILGVSYISKSQQIAADLATYTAQGSSNGPLVGKAQIPKFVESLTATDFSSTDDQFIKNRREAVTRALADVGQSRTWNLLIDITAQVGRFPPSATTLDQFYVEGERRYWLHLALDRVTGQVVDQQLEVVNQ